MGSLEIVNWESVNTFKSTINLQQDIIDAVIKIGEKYDINKIILFGSRARGDNQNTSDIDLAVFYDERFDDESELYFELKDLHTLLKVDIVLVKHNTDKKFVENIMREGVIIYERKQQ